MAAQVGRDHVNVDQSRRQADEAQAVRLNAMQAQQRPAHTELRYEERRGVEMVHRPRLSPLDARPASQETRMLPRPPETSISTRFVAPSKSGDAQPSIVRGKRASSTLVEPIAIRERTRAATP